MKYEEISLGKWLGIPVSIHWSFILMLAIVLACGLQAFVTYVGVFSIVLLHEFGHCLAIKHYHCIVAKITLYVFGGIAMGEIPIKPKEEIVVALAGPAVNVVLIPVLFGINWLHPNEIVNSLFNINLLLLIFNMIPALPMDGGRVLRGTMACFCDRELATLIAGRISQVVCVVMTLLGLWFFNFVLVLIGLMIFFEAENEIKRTSRPY